MRTRLLVIAAVDLTLLGGAIALRRIDTLEDSAVSWAIAAIGIVTLLGLLSGRDENTKVTTRFALTVAVSAVWFASVGSLLFFAGEKGPLAGEAFNGISLVMGVVVSFYFGAQAYEAVGKARASAEATSEAQRSARRGSTTRGGVSDTGDSDGSSAPPEVYD